LGLNNGLQMHEAGFKIMHMAVEKGFDFSYLLVTFTVMRGKFAGLKQEPHHTAQEYTINHQRYGVYVE